ncbi:MAG: hypothetical protein LBG87_08110, partial [Spirochaetaceae bacterium]|nr:hypothetical protein [Spirochaetaceae bacterium]
KWDWGSPDGGWAAGAADEVTPTGQFEKKISLSVAAQWKPIRPITLKAGLGGVIALNSKNSDTNQYGIQAVFSAGYAF